MSSVKLEKSEDEEIAPTHTSSIRKSRSGTTEGSAQPSANDAEETRRKLYPPEYRKLALCVFSFLFSVLLNHLAISNANDVASRNALPDLAFTVLPQQDWALVVGDLVCALAGSISLLFLLIFHQHRFIIVRRMFFTASILYYMRAVCLSVTHIPSSYSDNNRKCILPDHNASWSTISKRIGYMIYTAGMQLGDKEGRIFCGDLLFSGHTIFVSTTTFYMNHYTPHSVWPLRWLLIMMCVVGMFCLTLSRTHYTADVLIAYWLSSLMFSIYHAFTTTPHETRVRSRAFRRLILFWMMFELEVNVPSGRLPNDLEWPFPWPDSVKKFVRCWSQRRMNTAAGRIAAFIEAHRIKTHL